MQWTDTVFGKLNYFNGVPSSLSRYSNAMHTGTLTADLRVSYGTVFIKDEPQRFLNLIGISKCKQLPGRLFSSSDIRKQKTVPTLFIAFLNWYWFLWPPRKISGCVSGPSTYTTLRIHSNFLFPKGGSLWNKFFLEGPEKHSKNA